MSNRKELCKQGEKNFRGPEFSIHFIVCLDLFYSFPVIPGGNTVVIISSKVSYSALS